MSATHPDKQLVRDLMQQHRAENTPPMDPETIRQQLGWKLIEAERAATKPQ